MSKSSYGVIQQNSITDFIKPKVRLISYTKNPVATQFLVWHGSRNTSSYDPDEIEEIAKGETLVSQCNQRTSDEIARIYGKPSGTQAIRDVVKTNVASGVPTSDFCHFVFEVDDATVTFREQLVRQKFTSIWTQSSRVMDMRQMDISINDSVKTLGGDEALKVYKEATDYIRNVYDTLISLGVPQEDIRLQPLNCTHRLYFSMSLRTLVRVIGSRMSWIAQVGVWTPIISQILEILDNMGYRWMIPNFHTGAKIENINGEYKVTSYDYEMDSHNRITGDDPLPADPLYLAYKGYKGLPKHTNMDHYNYMKSMFINLWSDEILDVLGWDRGNPSKLGYYDQIVE